jgi:SAM-dependent methyltransferase
MGIMGRLGQQWRKPTGWLGRLLLRAMNINHSKLTDWALGHTSIGIHDTILDVGCGGGSAVNKLARIASQGKVYGIDFSEESVKVARATTRQLINLGRVEIRQGSVSRLPFSDAMFDLVTAVNTHNYWPDLVADMQEVLRVLKPGGKLMIVGGGYKGGRYADRNEKFAELVNIPLHSVNELSELFSMAGYSDVQMFEEYDWGWICGIGRKPRRRFSGAGGAAQAGEHGTW